MSIVPAPAFESTKSLGGVRSLVLIELRDFDAEPLRRKVVVTSNSIYFLTDEMAKLAHRVYELGEGAKEFAE